MSRLPGQLLTYFQPGFLPYKRKWCYRLQVNAQCVRSFTTSRSHDQFLWSFMWKEIVSRHWNILLFLGAFAKLRKATIICPSVRMEQLGSQWRDFHEIWYLSFFFFENVSRKIQVSLKPDKNNGCCTYGLIYIFIRPRSVLLGMRNVSKKKCREIRNTRIMFNIFFILQSCRLSFFTAKMSARTHLNVTLRTRCLCHKFL